MNTKTEQSNVETQLIVPALSDCMSQQEIVGAQFIAPAVGRIVGTVESGMVLVKHSGYASVPARWITSLDTDELSRFKTVGSEVLLVFEGGNPERPIIVGVIHDPLDYLVSMEMGPASSERPKEVVIDGQRVTIEAKEEIVLKCGEGSITLRKDGKIVIKGTHLLSRSSGPNRVKGGSVQIN
jgi:hypothetical protein